MVPIECNSLSRIIFFGTSRFVFDHILNIVMIKVAILAILISVSGGRSGGMMHRYIFIGYFSAGILPPQKKVLSALTVEKSAIIKCQNGLGPCLEGAHMM